MQYNSRMAFTMKGKYYVCAVLLVVGLASSINHSDDSLYIKEELYVFSMFYGLDTRCKGKGHPVTG